LEGLLEIMGLEVMAEGVSAGTHLEGWRERIPESRSFNTETADAKRCADGTDNKVVSDNIRE